MSLQMFREMRRGTPLLLLLAGACSSSRGADPYLALDPRPFGLHPAVAHGIGGDPWSPAEQAGLAWTREGDAPYLFWSLVDPDRTGDPTKMHFAGTVLGPGGMPMTFDYDAGIGQAVASGLNVLWNIAVEPVPSPAYSKPGSWEPVDAAAYASFVSTAVRRYPEVRAWQVANEPNASGVRGLAGFATLERITYQAIKEANPNAVVVMGGAAGGMTRQDLTDGYFDPVFDDLHGCCMDVFDFHFYGDPRDGTLGLLPYSAIDDAAAFYRSHLDAHGFAGARLWSTENGTFSGTVKIVPDDPGVSSLTATEADQARDVPKRTVVALADHVDKVFWAYGMTEGFGAWDDDFFDHTGLLYDGHDGPAGAKKLAYWSLWQMTRQLTGCDFSRVQRLATTVADTRAYSCPLKGGGEVVAAWWDTPLVAGYADGETVRLTLPWADATAVARAAVPSAASGAEVTDPSTAFAVTTLSQSAGSVTVVLGADPVWIRAR